MKEFLTYFDYEFLIEQNGLLKEEIKILQKFFQSTKSISKKLLKLWREFHILSFHLKDLEKKVSKTKNNRQNPLFKEDWIIKCLKKTLEEQEKLSELTSYIIQINPKLIKILKKRKQCKFL